MLLKIQAKPININIIQAYAPTFDRSEEEVDQFYGEIKELLKLTKAHEINIIQSDFNAKVGKTHADELTGPVGPFGLGNRNTRGDRLVQFCQEENLKITNTWFSLPPRRLYTWRSPQDSVDNIVRNQIDFILVNKRFSTSVRRVCTYPGADVPSDHVLLLASYKLKLSLVRRQSSRRQLAIENLKNDAIKSELQHEINEQLKGLQGIEENTEVEDLWNDVKSVIKNTTRNIIGQRNVTPKRKWMTEEILQLMDERRRYKNCNTDQYRLLNSKIRSEIRKAKRRWLERECREMEELQEAHNTHGEHKKLKEITGIYKRRPAAVLVNDNGEIIVGKDQRRTIWEEYVTRLFGDDDRGNLEINLENVTLSGPAITQEEIRKAIQQAKNNKAAGPDEIPTEIIKLIDDDNIALLETIFNKIYNDGKFPSDWLTSTFIPIPKKVNAKKCNEHRLISLMSHTLKIFLRIVHNRIYKKCEANLKDTQFGFRNGMGTREALFGVRVLVQNCRDVQKDVFLCFVDYERAFDSIQHEKLIKILKTTDMDEKDIRCIQNLYWYQTAYVTTNNLTTDEIEIRRGVRQGCILSPLLFNLYSEAIFNEVFEDEDVGVKVNGVRINNIRYADDSVLIAENIEDLQFMMDKLNNTSKNYGLKINNKKTKFMIVSRRRTPHVNARLSVDGVALERVTHYKYLGSWLDESWDDEREIRCRIEVGRSCFFKFKNILTNKDISLQLRMRYTRCYVWSVLLYGVETWSLKTSLINKLEAFEMWSYRRILRVPWTDRVSNEDILRGMGKDREFLLNIKKRKTAYFGHIMRNRNYQLLQIIIEGKIEGRRGVGRKQMSWLRNIREWTGLRNIGDLVHTATDREAYKNVIANIQ